MEQHSLQGERLVEVEAVAARLSVTKDRVYRLVQLRRIPFYRINGSLRFKSADVEAFLTTRRVDADDRKPYGKAH